MRRASHQARLPSVTVPTSTSAVAAAVQEASADDFQEDEARAEPSTARPEEFRLLEALLFAASEPLDEKTLGKRLPEGTDGPTIPFGFAALRMASWTSTNGTARSG